VWSARRTAYRIPELWFDSQEDLQGSMSPPEGQATVADIGTFATGGATVLIAGRAAATGRRPTA